MNNTIRKGLILLWLSHFFVDFCVGIWPIYKTIAAFDIAKAGLIASVTSICGEFFQVFWGGLSDRGHRKKVLLLGILLSSSILLITRCDTISSCFIVLLLVMMGSGTYHPAAVGSASRLAGEQKGSALLFFASGGAFGWAISQLSFTKITSLFGGHATLLFLPFAALFAFIALYPVPESPTPKAAFNLKKFFEPLWDKRRSLMPLYFSQVCNQAIISSVVFLLPDLLKAKGCQPWLCFGGGHLCLILGSAFISVPAGILSDKYGSKTVLLAFLLLALSLFYFFLGQEHLPLWATAGLLFFLGAFLFTANPMTVSWGNQILPEHPSTVSGLLMGFAWCIGYAGPAATGMLVKSSSHVFALAAMGSCILFSFLFVLAMPKRQTQESPLT